MPAIRRSHAASSRPSGRARHWPSPLPTLIALAVCTVVAPTRVAAQLVVSRSVIGGGGGTVSGGTLMITSTIGQPVAAPTSAAGPLDSSAGFWTPNSLATYKLTVHRAGNGAGVVTSTGGLINCGGTCEAGLVYGTSVTLSAAPATGSSFTGWSGGGCSGTGTCTVTMNAANTVTATFVLNGYRLTVTMAGWGSGAVVTTSPSGAIDCGRICDASFNHGTVVVLSATPSPGSGFVGWSGGGCSGTGTCTVTMTTAASVTATMYLLPPTFTDPTLMARQTAIKAAHITELRSAIDHLRSRYSLGPFPWTDPTLTPGATVAKALHAVELRTALATAYVAAGRAQPAYTQPVPTSGSVIGALQIAEIRAAVLALW